MKTIKVVAAIIIKDNKILIAKRKKGDFAGMYEFPGGKIEPGETGQEALIREIDEELATKIKIDAYFMNVKYQYPTFNLDMDCYLCQLMDDHMELHDHSLVKWIEIDEAGINWIPADIQIIEALKKRV